MTLVLFVSTLLSSMLIGVPIAFALLLCGIVLMYHLDLLDAQIIVLNLLNGADNFPLMAVPFFVLAGEIMNAGGLAKRIVNFALTLVGHLKGGLGYVSILTSCILASLSGSAIADAAALAVLLVPMMTGAGYDRAQSSGLVAAGGIIAPIIPPSIAFVIFGVIGSVSISKLFLAGIVPGILMGSALAAAWWWRVRGQNFKNVAPRKSRREVWHALRDGAWALMLPLIIIFGLRFGIFTPTEAAVVVAVYALFVATVIYRELKWMQIYEVLVNAAVTTSTVMFLVAAALVAGWVITVSEIAPQIIGLLEPLMAHPTLLLLTMMALIVLIGTALDMTATILILTPILMPVVKLAGIDPVYFGVLFVLNGSIGLITPPVGSVLNVVCGITKLPMEQLIKGIWPFLLAQVGVLLLLVLFPGLVTAPVAWIAG